MTMFFLLLISALFPYTTLFRSQLLGNAVGHQSGIELGLAYFSHPYVSGHAEHLACLLAQALDVLTLLDRKSTRLNSSHVAISYAVFCLKKKNNYTNING